MKVWQHWVGTIGSLVYQLSGWLVAIAVYSVAVDTFQRNYPFQVIDWGAEAGIAQTVILGLLMGFRNRTAYDRWWEGRRLWGQLINDTRNLAWKLAAALPATELQRIGMLELLHGFAVALKQHLRKEPLQLQDLPGFAAETATPNHVPSYLAGRLFQHLADWQRTGALNPTTFWTLDPHARALLDVCGGCERIRNTELAPSYKALLRVGLLLNVLAGPWFILPELGFWCIPVMLTICVYLLGVELIDSRVEEPFGTTHDDLDLDRYCQTIHESLQLALPSPRSH